MTGQNFDAKSEARRLMREAMTGALATLRDDGSPFASLAAVGTKADGRPVLLLSRLAVHTRNLERDPRVSLLIAAAPRESDPLAGPRLSLVGRAERLAEPAGAGRRFLARHPSAAAYAGFGDFGFWEIAPDSGHLVAGFGRIADIEARDLLTDLAGAEAMLDIEESAVRHMNEDHADAIRLYATRLLGEEDGAWRVVGLDPQGMDLALDGRVRRLDFPERVTDAAGLRLLLRRLGEQAR